MVENQQSMMEAQQRMIESLQRMMETQQRTFETERRNLEARIETLENSHNHSGDEHSASISIPPAYDWSAMETDERNPIFMIQSGPIESVTYCKRHGFWGVKLNTPGFEVTIYNHQGESDTGSDEQTQYIESLGWDFDDRNGYLTRISYRKL